MRISSHDILLNKKTTIIRNSERWNLRCQDWLTNLLWKRLSLKNLRKVLRNKGYIRSLMTNLIGLAKSKKISKCFQSEKTTFLPDETVLWALCGTDLHRTWKAELLGRLLKRIFFNWKLFKTKTMKCHTISNNNRKIIKRFGSHPKVARSTSVSIFLHCSIRSWKKQTKMATKI